MSDNTTHIPQFTHDCPRCVFLSRSADGTHDLYVCTDERHGSTFVARYGNDGPEYTSANEHVLPAVAKFSPYVVEAAALAKARGETA